MNDLREFFTSCVLGFSAIFVGRILLGLDWVYAILLYFPVNGLSRRILANDGRGAVRCASMLALYPFVTVFTPFVLRLCLKSMVRHGDKVPDGVGMIVITAIIALLLLLCVFMAATFIANCVGRFSLPAMAHAVLARVMLSVATLLVMVVAIRLMQEVDARYIRIPLPLKMTFSILFMAASAFMLGRVFSSKMPERAMKVVSENSKPSSARRVPHTGVKMSDVMGMDKAKEQIRLRLIEPVRNPDRARRYGLKVGGGMLLYGPPGTGKTMLARAVAGELNLPFYMITSADVFGKYVGESEQNIRKIFSEVRKNPLSVVFIDELETLFPKRTADVHETTRKVISLLLQELDGIDAGKNPILLLGATNVPWMVDEAFLRPGRFDAKIFVDLPDAAARRNMLIAAFAKGNVPHEPGLTAYMAERTKHYSGADLNGVMDRIRQLAYARNVKCYDRALADEAIASITPSANGALMDQIHDWEAETMSDASGNSGGNGVRIAVRPTVKLDDVAGMEDVKEQIRMRLIEPMRNAALASYYGIRTGGGMLLYGPPGTGKTFLAKAVAGELSLPFFSVTAADIFGKYIGESEKNVRKLFREIRKNELSVVFIDELETIFPKRTADVHETTRKVISLLLQELDGLDGNKNPILLLGATNVPWMVDEAFLRPGRFDISIYIGAPDLKARHHMLYHAFERGGVPYEEGIVEHVAQCTENFSGADLNGVMERIRQVAFSKRSSYYTIAIADEVLSGSRPSINGELVERIKNWERSQAHVV